jgi:hypothetical protein
MRNTHLDDASLRQGTQMRASLWQRAPQPREEHHALLASMSSSGMGAVMAVEGTTTKIVFETYVEGVLAPTLSAG